MPFPANPRTSNSQPAHRPSPIRIIDLSICHQSFITICVALIFHWATGQISSQAANERLDSTFRTLLRCHPSVGAPVKQPFTAARRVKQSATARNCQRLFLPNHHRVFEEHPSLRDTSNEPALDLHHSASVGQPIANSTRTALKGRRPDRGGNAAMIYHVCWRPSEYRSGVLKACRRRDEVRTREG